MWNCVPSQMQSVLPLSLFQQETVHAKSLAGVGALHVLYRFSFSPPSHFRSAAFFWGGGYHPFAKWGCPPCSRAAEQRFYLVFCQPAPPFHAAASPHSPTQPPTSWRNSLWGHPMTSQLYKCGFRRGADVRLCEWANPGQAWWRELGAHDASLIRCLEYDGKPFGYLRWRMCLQAWGCGSADFLVFPLFHVGCFIGTTVGYRPSFQMDFVSLVVSCFMSFLMTLICPERVSSCL